MDFDNLFEALLDFINNELIADLTTTKELKKVLINIMGKQR